MSASWFVSEADERLECVLFSSSNNSSSSLCHLVSGYGGGGGHYLLCLLVQEMFSLCPEEYDWDTERLIYEVETTTDNGWVTLTGFLSFWT